MASFFEGDVIKNLFPKGYELLAGTNQIYELKLAYGEAEKLTKSELLKRGAYFRSIDGEKTNHFKICSTSPVQVDKSASARRKSFFKANQYKTGYATHGLFPYRGKFHPQMIKAIINIIGLQEQDVVLDPMVGSGTTCIEASILGLKSIGREKSPFGCLMSEAKVFGLTAQIEKIESYESEAKNIFNFFHSKKLKNSLTDYSQNDSTPSIDSPFKEVEYENLFKLCYLDAMGYTERRKNKKTEELFPVVLERYVQAIKNFAKMKEELGLRIGNADIKQGDACKLEDINDNTIDGIITSPPYSFSIDYVKNDKPQLEYMGIDTDNLRKSMIGLKGNNLENRVKNYFEDMDKIMQHMSRVLKPGKSCVIIVGTNTNQLRAILGNKPDIRIENELIKLGKKYQLEITKKIVRPIQGIRNIMRDESILFFRKD